MACFVVMGVSGCGKSSVGNAVANQCSMNFIDGDDLHPTANIAKMANGVALTDADRWPWLDVVGQTLAGRNGPMILGCSALKPKYRDRIAANLSEPMHFLHLDAPQDVLESRVAARTGHFMPPELLAGQFAILERLEDDEHGVEIDISQPFAQVVEATETYVRKIMS